MNLNQVARLMAGFAGLCSLAQLPPLVSALTEDNRSALAPIAGFASSIVVGLVVAGLLWLAGRRDRTQIFRKETIAVAGLSWFLAGMIGAIPFWVSGLLDNPIDAFFEAEKRILGSACRHCHNDVVKHHAGAVSHINVSHRHRIKGAGVDGRNTHAGLSVQVR